MSWVSSFVRGQVRSLLFLSGFVAFVWGISQWSVPGAAVVAGGMVMGLTAAPFVRRASKGA